MEFVDLIKNFTSDGIVQAVVAVLTFVVVVALEVTKNKIVKRLSETEEDKTKLSGDLKDVKQVAENSNQIISLVIDILHIVYLNSNLSPQAKMAVQKVYDSCPDGIKDQIDLAKLLDTPATEEQEKAVEETIPTEKSYADIISEKLQ